MPDRSGLQNSMKAALRPFFWAGSDLLDRIRGELIPPRQLRSQVPGDFRAVGKEFLGHARTLGGLLPEHRLLDIGCGPGRFALPLTGYLSAGGRYQGVDTWPEAVDWCNRNIGARFHNFRFDSIPAPQTDSQGPEIPLEDATFDFATLCALSRLDLDSYGRYMAEAGRLLRPGGVLMATLFLVTPRGRSQKTGQTVVEPGRRVIMNTREMTDLISSSGLELVELYPGTWDYHPAPLSYQDLIVTRRPDP
jgi:SAM-dependent methyltransferase